MTSTQVDGALTVRHATSEDVPLILSSWVNSYRRSAKGINRIIYEPHQRALVMAILKRSTVLVACNPELPPQVMAYLVGETISGVCVVHYVYTKLPFRGLGIARHLLTVIRGHSRGMQHSHRTDKGDRLAQLNHSAFNPYLGFGVLP